MGKNDTEAKEEYLERCAQVWKRIEEGLIGKWMKFVRDVKIGNYIKLNVGIIGKERKNVQVE